MNQKGFTLIELIAVLIIISVLSAAAIPKFIDLQGNAEKKLLGMVLVEFNSQEVLAYNNARLSETEYVSPIPAPDQLSRGLKIEKIDENSVIVFTGGGEYTVYRWDYKDSDGDFYQPSTWHQEIQPDYVGIDPDDPPSPDPVCKPKNCSKKKHWDPNICKCVKD